MLSEISTSNAWRDVVTRALREDLGTGDVTVQALVPPERRGAGRIVAKETGVLFGLVVARLVFEEVDPAVTVHAARKDGQDIAPGDEIMTVTGSAASLLKGERVALNFLQHLSGVASHTARFVQAVEGTGAQILDTRKTTPGLRSMEKAAVKAAGGVNHRLGLYDMLLIKDNHLALWDAKHEADAVKQALSRALPAAPPGMAVQVEVTSLEAALEAGRSGAHMILLDNMPPDEMAAVMEALEKTFGSKRPKVEASGGVTLAKVREIAASGVDRISIGALTHSPPALDIAMYIRID
jgi:nicotinate-nucleotide pyrophosphorylase (carboxylating)